MGRRSISNDERLVQKFMIERKVLLWFVGEEIHKAVE